MKSASGLLVDPVIHAAEIERFLRYVVCGPDPNTCNIWVGAIGADGYSRFYLTRQGIGSCVRAHRYALALSQGLVEHGVLGLHECDVPLCVKVAPAHVVAGSQSDNMIRMARMRRGGGRYAVRRGDSRPARRARSVALRAAVRHGWDSAAVESALIGDQPTLW